MSEAGTDQPALAPEDDRPGDAPGGDPKLETTQRPEPEAEVKATPGTEVAVVGDAEQGSIVTANHRDEWAPGNAGLIRQTVASDCNNAEFSMFLELCARYQLDPFAKQIWAAKIGGRVAIIVSRDGLLAIANRNADYEGLDGDTVRKKDMFRKYHGPDGLVVEHEVTSGDVEERGEIVGSWAVVHRTGRHPTYFYAPFKEYKKGNVWDSNPSAMILKVSEAMALRKAYSVSGVVGEDEVAGRLDRDVQNTTAAPTDPSYGDDPSIEARLRELFDALNFSPRKRVVTLAPMKSDADRQKLITRLDQDARALGIEVPFTPEGDQLRGETEADEGEPEAEAEPEPVDAEVVA